LDDELPSPAFGRDPFFAKDFLRGISKCPSLTTQNARKIVVCHDYKGGYKEDKWHNAFHTSYNFPLIFSPHCYRWQFWNYIDFFIYFSHARITIPTAPYINLAHLHGVKCFGTLITEGQAGEEDNFRLLTGQVQHFSNQS
jgi:mannosyl-glycoprotein endo-beta-N-acetylglucosaminidase